jgi:hypothetical protein
MIKSNGLPARKQLAVKINASPLTNIAVPHSGPVKQPRLQIRSAAPKIVYTKPGR